MKLTLLKKHAGSEIGTVIDVSDAAGPDLIAKGIARNPTVDEVTVPSITADQANKALGYPSIADQLKKRTEAAKRGGKPIIDNLTVRAFPVGSR